MNILPSGISKNETFNLEGKGIKSFCQEAPCPWCLDATLEYEMCLGNKTI